MVSNDTNPQLRHPRARTSCSPRSVSAPPPSNVTSPEREDTPPVPDDEPHNRGSYFPSPAMPPTQAVYHTTLGSRMPPSRWEEAYHGEDVGQPSTDLDSGLANLERVAAYFEDRAAGLHAQAELARAFRAQVAAFREQDAASQAQIAALRARNAATQSQDETPQTQHPPRLHHDEQVPDIVGIRLIWNDQEWPPNARAAGERALAWAVSIYCTALVIMIMVGLDNLWHGRLGWWALGF